MSNLSGPQQALLWRMASTDDGRLCIQPKERRTVAALVKRGLVRLVAPGATVYAITAKGRSASV